MTLFNESTSTPMSIVNGPDRMDLMLALFDGKEVFFALDHRRNKTWVKIWSLHKVYSDGTYWTMEGNVKDPTNPAADLQFTATYLTRGGERTGRFEIKHANSEQPNA